MFLLPISISDQNAFGDFCEIKLLVINSDALDTFMFKSGGKFLFFFFFFHFLSAAKICHVLWVTFIVLGDDLYIAVLRNLKPTLASTDT